MVKTYSELYLQNENLPGNVPFWKRITRILYDAGRGFIEDDCYSKASALTFYSLLSIVPVFAVLFGIAKGFGFDQALEHEIRANLLEQKEIVDKLIEFAYSWLQNAQGGIIAGIGTVALLWTVTGLLSNVENCLNAIWKVPYSRPWGRKISDYLATMLICPIFLVTSSSITVYLSTQITYTAQSSVIVEAISPLLLFILKLSPFFLSWILFTFIYLFMPNTKVYWRSALIAGIIGGTAFQLWQWLYIRFQIGVAGYGAIYGSLAALPLFLIWLQFSWLTLLAGAELAYEIENDLFIPFRRAISLTSKVAALLVTYRCIESFIQGKPPQNVQTLASELGISFYHLNKLLEVLQKFRIISAISYRDKTIGYQPAQSIDSITMIEVCKAIDKSNELIASVKESAQLRSIQKYLQEMDNSLAKLPINQPLYKALSPENDILKNSHF